MASVLVDQKDRERRSKIVLIFGVEPSGNDNIDERVKEDGVKIEEILAEMQINKKRVVNFFRFRSRPDQNYPRKIRQ